MYIPSTPSSSLASLWQLVGCDVALAPSAAPRAVHGRALNSTSVLVAWSPPPADRQNGPIARYRLLYAAAVARDDARGGQPSSVSVPGSRLTHVLDGLDRWTQYRVWVTAATSAGEGPRSDVIVVQTDDDGQSASPACNSLPPSRLYCFVKAVLAIGNESAPTQLAQCWFPGLAISNPRI